MKKIAIMVKWKNNQIIDVSVFKTRDEAWASIATNKGTCYAQIFEKEVPA